MVRNFLNAFRILGTFNLILIIGLALIGAAMWNVSTFSNTVLKIIDTSTEHDVYNDIQWSFLHIQQTGRDYLIYTDNSFVDEQYNSTLARIDDQLARLDELDLSVPEGPEGIAQILDNIEAGYLELLDTPTATDTLVVPDNLYLISNQETQFNQAMADLVAEISGQVDTAIRKYQAERAFTIEIGIIILGIFPLLALWGFVAASGFTTPLIQMANALAAISGQTYQADTLKDSRRAGAVGPLATALDHMAQAVATRRQRLEQDSETLRDELYDLQLSKLDVLVTQEEAAQEQLSQTQSDGKGK